MKVVAIVEARMTSTRLPGKVLMEVLHVPMLGRLVHRLKQVSLIHEIVIATTINRDDDEICQLASKYGVNFYRGSENDVMTRVLEAGLKYNAEVIVEITGDCPIVDIEIIEDVILQYINGDYDYVSNANVRSFPDGMDVQVFGIDTLSDSHKATTDMLHREHVTLHIRQNPEKYRLLNIIAKDEYHFPDLGLTLDTPEDFTLLKEIICHLEPKNQFFGLREVILLLEKFPDLRKINQNILRKGDT